MERIKKNLIRVISVEGKTTWAKRFEKSSPGEDGGGYLSARSSTE